jgi:hypothetical protein
VSEAHQRTLHLEKTLARKLRGVVGGNNNGSSHTNPEPPNHNTVPPPTWNWENRGQANTQPNRVASTSATPQSFKCCEVVHMIADCRKGDRYDKGLLTDKE